MARRSPVKPFPYFRDAGRDPINTLPVRVLSIPVSRIVGSVGKADNLTALFLPRKQKARSRRFRSIQQAMQRGVQLPPIEVYGLRREFYVIDGHNRVAAALANGLAYLDAYVHECILPERSPEDRLVNVRMHFERRTGLGRIHFTHAGDYSCLMDELKAYRDRLKLADSHVTLREAARRWYRDVFVPTAERLDFGATAEAFPGKTVSDLYLMVVDHRAALERERGCAIAPAEALADFQAAHPVPLPARVLRPLHRYTRRFVWHVGGGPPVR